jgi:hypothetical protein
MTTPKDWEAFRHIQRAPTTEGTFNPNYVSWFTRPYNRVDPQKPALVDSITLTQVLRCATALLVILIVVVLILITMI